MWFDNVGVLNFVYAGGAKWVSKIVLWDFCGSGACHEIHKILYTTKFNMCTVIFTN